MIPTPKSEYHGHPKCFWCKERNMERVGVRLFRCRNEACIDCQETGIGKPQAMRFGPISGIYLIPLDAAILAEKTEAIR